VGDWRMGEARNQGRSRETNEWIEEATNSFGSDEPLTAYRCECGDPACAACISITRAEYEAVRAHGGREEGVMDVPSRSTSRHGVSPTEPWRPVIASRGGAREPVP
jgi:hypothetical protein